MIYWLDSTAECETGLCEKAAARLVQTGAGGATERSAGPLPFAVDNKELRLHV